VPAFARDRFAAVIAVPGAASMTMTGGKLWVLGASGTVVGIDPASNAAVGKPLRVPANAEAIAVGNRAGPPASPPGTWPRQASMR
jgi:hypothetical protein